MCPIKVEKPRRDSAREFISGGDDDGDAAGEGANLMAHQELASALLSRYDREREMAAMVLALTNVVNGKASEELSGERSGGAGQKRGRGGIIDHQSGGVDQLSESSVTRVCRAFGEFITWNIFKHVLLLLFVFNYYEIISSFH